MDSNISGELELVHWGDCGYYSDRVQVTGKINGKKQKDFKEGLHGFHVHAGTSIDTCHKSSSLGHFEVNAAKFQLPNHGAPGEEDRHEGDLGNIHAKDDQKSSARISKALICFVISRAIAHIETHAYQ